MHRFTRGKGLFYAVEYVPADEQPEEGFPLILTTGRYDHHYHAGTMTRRSKGLELLCPEGFVAMNPRDARRVLLADGDRARLNSRRGQIEICVRESEGCPAGLVFVPLHFSESMENRFTDAALDPTGKTPEFKVCAVSVEKG